MAAQKRTCFWGDLATPLCEGDTGNDRVRGGREGDFLNVGSDDDGLIGDDGNETSLGRHGSDNLNSAIRSQR